jgi:hypothetical protein
MFRLPLRRAAIRFAALRTGTPDTHFAQYQTFLITL